MSLRRLRPWDVVLAALGVLLWLVMRLEWYERLEGGVSAYEAFGATDVLLALLGALAVAVVVATAAARRPAVPLPFLVLTTTLSLILSLLLLYRIANQPGRNADVAVSPGAWIGLACVLALLYSAYRALRDERSPGIEPGPAPQRQPPPAAADAPPAAADAPPASG